jgi:O-antigen/teichoic acid export membrane protein
MSYWLSFIFAAVYLVVQMRSKCNNDVILSPSSSVYGWHTHLNFTNTALLSYVSYQLDTLWLAHYLSPADLGSYNMACNIVRLVIFFPMIVVTLLQPRLASALSARDVQHIRRLVGFAMLLSFSAALLSAFILTLFGDWFLEIIHPTYLSASISLRWLIAVHCVNAALMVWIACLAVSDRYSNMVWVQVPGAVVTVSLYAWAIPIWGMPAAPAAVLAGTLVSALIYFSIFYKHMNSWHALLLPSP